MLIILDIKHDGECAVSMELAATIKGVGIEKFVRTNYPGDDYFGAIGMLTDFGFTIVEDNGGHYELIYDDERIDDVMSNMVGKDVILFRRHLVDKYIKLI